MFAFLIKELASLLQTRLYAGAVPTRPEAALIGAGRPSIGQTSSRAASRLRSDSEAYRH